MKMFSTRTFGTMSRLFGQYKSSQLPLRVVLATGDYTPDGPTNSVEVLIPGESWRVLNIFKVPGNLGRVWFRMETAGDHIYCVAGHTGRGTCNMLHRYNRCRATWRMMPRMLRRRYDFLSAILQNKIYMTGRSHDVNLTSLNQSEAFNIATGEWEEIKSMRGSRAGHTSITFKGELFVFGGTSGYYNHQWIEKYDPRTDYWD